jgi:hypothetical protein
MQNVFDEIDMNYLLELVQDKVAFVQNLIGSADWRRDTTSLEERLKVFQDLEQKILERLNG